MIDLNVDIGEGFAHDAELLKFATSANVCCGVHAGDEELTKHTLELCRKQRVRVGAHPGYPDRANMGRKSMEPGQEREYLRSLFDQLEWFASFAEPAYVKPHGAFYNDTAIVLPTDWQIQKRTRETYMPYDTGGLFLAQYPGIHSLQMMLRIHRLPLLGLPGTSHVQIARRAGQDLIREGFADRRYGEGGTLVPRTEPGSVLQDPEAVRQQVVSLAPHVDSICLHGDTDNCLEFAELVYKTLTDEGYGIAA
jgi:UPF0271 protein